MKCRSIIINSKIMEDMSLTIGALGTGGYMEPDDRTRGAHLGGYTGDSQ
jgi:hypothetical protein